MQCLRPAMKVWCETLNTNISELNQYSTHNIQFNGDILFFARKICPFRLQYSRRCLGRRHRHFRHSRLFSFSLSFTLFLSFFSFFFFLSKFFLSLSLQLQCRVFSVWFFSKNFFLRYTYNFFLLFTSLLYLFEDLFVTLLLCTYSIPTQCTWRRQRSLNANGHRKMKTLTHIHKHKHSYEIRNASLFLFSMRLFQFCHTPSHDFFIYDLSFAYFFQSTQSMSVCIFLFYFVLL